MQCLPADGDVTPLLFLFLFLCCAVSDEGIFPQEVIDARAAKEAAAIASWHANTAGMTSLADLHAWLYATHLCYSVSRQHEFGRRAGDLDPKLAATY